MGARGNSGVILSQLVSGALGSFRRRRRSTQTPSRASCAGQATPATRRCGSLRRARSSPFAAPSPSVPRRSQRTERRGGRARRPARRREVALARTTEQLDVLKQAGVVDAGGAGLLEIVRGIASYVRGEELPEPAPLLEAIPFEAVHQELSRFRYCTSFFVEGDGVDPERSRRAPRGWGTLCSSSAAAARSRRTSTRTSPERRPRSPPPSA